MLTFTIISSKNKGYRKYLSLDESILVIKTPNGMTRMAKYSTKVRAPKPHPKV